MPSKIQLDENLHFLYVCLQKSDMKAIDFHAVGAATSLKAPAARMRYTRLRRQIENGEIARTHTLSSATEETEAKQTRKRKRKDRHEEEEAVAKQEEDIKRQQVERDMADEADIEVSTSSESDSESNIPLSKLGAAPMYKSMHASPYPLSPSWTEVPRGGVRVRGNWPAAGIPIRGNASTAEYSYLGHTPQLGVNAGRESRSFHPIPGLLGAGQSALDSRFTHLSSHLNASGRPVAPGAWGIAMSPPPNIQE